MNERSNERSNDEAILQSVMHKKHPTRPIVAIFQGGRVPILASNQGSLVILRYFQLG